MCIGYVQTLHCFIPRTWASADFGSQGRSETTAHSQGCGNHYFCWVPAHHKVVTGSEIPHYSCLTALWLYPKSKSCSLEGYLLPLKRYNKQATVMPARFLPFHFSQITTFDDRFIYLHVQKLKISKTRYSVAFCLLNKMEICIHKLALFKHFIPSEASVCNDAADHCAGIIPSSSHL